MHVLRVVGPSDAGKTTLVERLTERLAEEGRVATVKHIDCDPDVDTEGKDTARHRAAGAEETYGVTSDGSWFATGGERSLPDLLDGFAPEYDYALVEGYGDAALPTVVLGGEGGDEADHDDEREYAGEILQRAPDADSADVEAVLDALGDAEPYETLESLVRRAKRSPDAEFSGAIATFTGRVRARDGPEDAATEFLEFEKYDGVAEEKMATISEELEAREGVYDVLLHHRTGVVEAGEDIVFVVVLAGHRAAAFETVEDGIDRLKAEVPLFKKEVTVDGEFWAHQHEEHGHD
ncbi:molybdopterin synthase [Haloarcula nitratireducens]|uniref:Molybdopterin synthase n=1 Tax=Haloarcula nitratireducens TaxID=2487749 RepID=A0AAW4P5W9_9EURY|nr:molybdopterin synthase [Halomicroarcula nitratireducens]MBX0293361.1 molybdopterin synthase [Halomicroarcula nitratireducens]